MGHEEAEAGRRTAFARITEVEVATARATARTLERRSRGRVGAGDLESLASTLLVEAALKFDETKGVSFRRYASAFVALRLRDAIRATGRTRRSETEEAALAMQSAFDKERAELEPTTRRAEAETVAALREALGRLDPVDAALMRGLYLEGKALAEVMAELGLPKTTAWRRRIEALAQVQRWMLAADGSVGACSACGATARAPEGSGSTSGSEAA